MQGFVTQKKIKMDKNSLIKKTVDFSCKTSKFHFCSMNLV